MSIKNWQAIQESCINCQSNAWFSLDSDSKTMVCDTFFFLGRLPVTVFNAKVFSNLGNPAEHTQTMLCRIRNAKRCTDFYTSLTHKKTARNFYHCQISNHFHKKWNGNSYNENNISLESEIYATPISALPRVLIYGKIPHVILWFHCNRDLIPRSGVRFLLRTMIREILDWSL